MRIEYRLTWKSMKQNPRRSLVSIFGVMICTAMISAIVVLADSLFFRAQQQITYTEGTYQVGFYDIKDDVVQRIKADAKVDTIGFITPQEVSVIAMDETLPVTMFHMQTSVTDLYGVHLLEGTMPKNKDEVVVNRFWEPYRNKDYQIDDTLKVMVDETEKEYRITGVVSIGLGEIVQDSSIVMFDQDVKNDQTIMLCNLTDDHNVTDWLTDDVQDTQHFINRRLLEVDGQAENSFLTIVTGAAVFLGGIILLCGAVLIYNSFAIALSQRSRSLGMLASAGATKQQKRNSVFFEAGLIAIVAIPFGIVCGLFGIIITLNVVEPFFEQIIPIGVTTSYHITWRSIWIPALFSICLLLLSAWFPARRASRISAISAIRQEDDYQIRKHDVRARPWIRRMFGFEAEFALRNIRRQRSRYMAVLLSLIMCIITFISSFSFHTTIQEGYKMTANENIKDVSVSFILDHKMDQNERDAFQSVQEAKNVAIIQHAQYLIPDLDHEQVNKTTWEQSSSIFEASGQDVNAIKKEAIAPGMALIVLDQQSYEKYLETLGVSETQDSSGVAKGIFVNQIALSYDGVYTNLTLFDRQDQDPFFYRLDVNSEMDSPLRLDIEATVDQLPDVVPSSSFSVNGTIIMSEQHFEIYEETLKKQGYTMYDNYEIVYQSDDAYALESELQTLSKQYPDQNFTIENKTMDYQRRNQIQFVISVFLYGFDILILCICIANIINTVTTSMALRRREFAMLRSTGMSAKGFYRMITMEGFFYGMSAILYGIPLSLLCMYGMNQLTGTYLAQRFEIPWITFLYIGVALLVLTLSCTCYAIRRFQKDNIVETIRKESL